MNQNTFHQNQFMLKNSEIPEFPIELFQKDRATFESQFNEHSSEYLSRLFLAFPSLFEEFILKAIEYNFIDLMNTSGNSSHLNINIDGVSLNYGFVDFRGKICVYLKTSDNPLSTVLVKLPIPLRDFAEGIVSNIANSIQMKFITSIDKKTNE